MKLTLPTLRIAAGLGLAAALMMGCQDLLNPGKSADPATAADANGALSLSIRDDSTCRGEWQTILDARSAGHPDSASETAFLASCVTEVKPEKDKPQPVVPPALQPDSGLRCKWIETQIEGGRDSLTVSYKRYCPDDCRRLEAVDSASHEKLCREPKPGPGLPPKHDEDSASRKGGNDSLSHKGHGDDSLPPKPGPEDDTCKMLHAKLDSVKPGEPGRADLEHLFAARCHEPVPHDSLPLPPKPLPGPEDDTCKMLHAKLDSVKPGEPGRADLEHLFALRCKEPVPRDSAVMPPPPPKDSGEPKLPPPPPAPDSVCKELALRLSAVAPGDSGRSELEAAFKAKCLEPVPVPPPVNCDELRRKLATLDPASADYARLAGALKEHCPDVPAK